MNIFKEVFLSKEGIRATGIIILGIVIASVVAGFFKNNVIMDAVSIFGIVVSLVGTQELSHLVVNYNLAHEEDK